MLHVTNRLRRIVFCALLCLPLVGCEQPYLAPWEIPTSSAPLPGERRPPELPTVSPSMNVFTAAETGRDWDYVVEQKATGAVHVSIRVEIDDPAVRETYARQAREAARALVETETGEVPVFLTLSEPLDVDAARALAEEYGLALEHISVEMRAKDDALAFAGVRVAEGDVERMVAGVRNHRLVGAVLLEGRVPAASLAPLAEDPRIYIPDTLHRDLAREVAEEYGVPIEAVEVWAPSPFWSMAVERGGE